jgi:hypothetical protein
MARRKSYAQRTQQTSRAALVLLAGVNGRDTDAHWSHDDIRAALIRRRAVEVEDLLEDGLPRQAIGHAVGKGWIYRAGGESWLSVTRRAAAELNLPKKDANGVTIRFLDTAKLPPSQPAFDAPKPVAKAEVTGERAAALVAQLREPRDVLAQAALYKAVLDETGWPALELAKRLYDDPADVRRAWDDVIYHVNMLTLEAEYQEAVAAGRISLAQAYELYRVQPAFRKRLFDGLLAGWSKRSIRQMLREITATAA